MTRRNDASKAQYHYSKKSLREYFENKLSRYIYIIQFTILSSLFSTHEYNLLWNIASSSSFNQSTIKNVANLWCKHNSNQTNFSNSIFLSSISFCSTSTILLILLINLFDCRKSTHRANFISTYQYIVIIISIYEERLITFKKWFHIISTSENLVAIEFYHDSNTEYFVICLKCDLKLNIKRDSIKIHMRQSRNCSFVQNWNKIKASKIVLIIAISMQQEFNI